MARRSKESESYTMSSVYNLLREACGISQAEAADYVHETRLDTVKSWSSDRRPAPEWAINQLQSLARRIRKSGEEYVELIKRTSTGNAFVIGLAHDEDDARVCGFPSIAAQNQSVATAISLLPDDAEIRLVPRVRGAIPAPTLPTERTLPTETDREVFMSMTFIGNSCTTRGNMNRRKFERLEDIGWIKGFPVKDDVQYELTSEGKAARVIRVGEVLHMPHPQTGELSNMEAIHVENDEVTLVDRDKDGFRRHTVSQRKILKYWKPKDADAI
jgi:hypothetical protein